MLKYLTYILKIDKKSCSTGIKFVDIYTDHHYSACGHAAGESDPYDLLCKEDCKRGRRGSRSGNSRADKEKSC